MCITSNLLFRSLILDMSFGTPSISANQKVGKKIIICLLMKYFPYDTSRLIFWSVRHVNTSCVANQPHSHQTRPLRLTTLHCIPSKKLITNMQNRLVHHLIGTKLRCALPKCMTVQNYIVNLDLHPNMMDIGTP